MYGVIKDQLQADLEQLKTEGLYKHESVLTTPQAAEIGVADESVLNLCANNYLGLADHPAMITAAQQALDRWGFGMASVRFICGTAEIHKELEGRLAEFLGTEDVILYGSCFDANAGLFETLLGPEDAIISDELNHASIIDGVRLCKAARYRYRNRDMADLEAQLEAAAGARYRMIATDGVFSMDGFVAPLDRIVELAEAHDALVMVDDSHAVGFVGPTGAGTPELFGVRDRVDVVTGTLGKALGGASGGYTAARSEMVDMLRQRSRPYLFSNSLAPSIAAAGIATLDLLESSGDLLAALRDNTAYFRRGDDRAWLRHPGVRPRDRAGDDRRRGRGGGHGRPAAGGRDLRTGLLVPGGAARKGPDPHPDVGRTHPRRPGPRHRGVRTGPVLGALSLSTVP